MFRVAVAFSPPFPFKIRRFDRHAPRSCPASSKSALGPATSDHQWASEAQCQQNQRTHSQANNHAMQRGQPIAAHDQTTSYVVRTSASKIVDGIFIGNKEAAQVCELDCPLISASQIFLIFLALLKMCVRPLCAVTFVQDFDFIMSNKISAIVNCAGSTVRSRLFKHAETYFDCRIALICVL
jgi:hypothetical protein